MNDKLKKFLEVIYTNPKDLLPVASKLLVDLPQHSTLGLFALLPDLSSIIALRNSMVTVFSNDKTFIDSLQAKSDDIAKKLSGKKESEWIGVAKDLCSNLYGEDKLFDDFENYYKEILQKNPLMKIPALALSAFSAAYANNDKNENIKNLEEFIGFAANSFENLRFSNQNLAQVCVAALKNVDKDLAAKTEKLFDRVLTATSLAYIPNQADHINFKAIEDEVGNLNYIEGMKNVSLIKDSQKVDDSITIEDAIKNFDLNKNSNLIAYALSKIEAELREKPALKNDNTGLAVLASEIAFLTLCDQYNKEVDDKLLAAFANPIIELNTVHSGAAIELVLNAAREASETVSGESTTLSPLQKGLNAGVITSIIKAPLEKILIVKKITLAVNNAKDAIREDHYKLVGSPIVGKKKKLPEGIAQDERDLMLNLNLTSKGKGKAAKILNAVVKNVLADYKKQAKDLKETREQLQEQFENNSLSQNEIDDFNKQVYDFNAKIDSLKKEINGMFVEGLKNKNLISETYANVAEDLYKD